MLDSSLNNAAVLSKTSGIIYIETSQAFKS